MGSSPASGSELDTAHGERAPYNDDKGKSGGEDGEHDTVEYLDREVIT